MPGSNVDGQICVNVPHGGRSLKFFVTSIQLRAAVLRVPELAVVGAGPDQALLDLRVLDVPDDLAGVLAEVVADDAAVRDDARRILRREIRAELGPRLAAVGRLQDQLAAVEHVVRDRTDRSPSAPSSGSGTSLRSAASRARPSTARSSARCRCARPSASPCCRSSDA